MSGYKTQIRLSSAKTRDTNDSLLSFGEKTGIRERLAASPLVAAIALHGRCKFSTELLVETEGRTGRGAGTK